jgi:S-(hydroxymethyl)glutathione dehydrogenase/alcohol dehydrogenase
MSGKDSEGRFPVVLGHEGAGVVEEVGPGVTSLAAGDHVIPLYTPECRQCRFCLSGKTNLCITLRATQGKGVMPDGTSRLSHRGRMLHHYMGTSTFAEATVLPEIAVAKIRKDAPLEKVCLLGCGVTTGIGAVLRTAKVEPGSSVAVFGLGGIGLSVIQGAVMAGAERIIGVDLNPKKFELARQLGATDCLNPSDVADTAQAIVDMTDGGVDYSFEAIGLKTTAEQCFDCLRPGGTATIIGMIPVGQKVELDGRSFLSEKKVQGSSMGSNRFKVDMPRYIDFYLQGRLKLDEMITRRRRLEDVNDAFVQMKAGEVARTVLMFD